MPAGEQQQQGRSSTQSTKEGDMSSHPQQNGSHRQTRSTAPALSSPDHEAGKDKPSKRDERQEAAHDKQHEVDKPHDDHPDHSGSEKEADPGVQVRKSARGSRVAALGSQATEATGSGAGHDSEGGDGDVVDSEDSGDQSKSGEQDTPEKGSRLRGVRPGRKTRAASAPARGGSGGVGGSRVGAGRGGGERGGGRQREGGAERQVRSGSKRQRAQVNYAEVTDEDFDSTPEHGAKRVTRQRTKAGGQGPRKRGGGRDSDSDASESESESDRSEQGGPRNRRRQTRAGPSRFGREARKETAAENDHFQGGRITRSRHQRKEVDGRDMGSQPADTKRGQRVKRRADHDGDSDPMSEGSDERSEGESGSEGGADPKTEDLDEQDQRKWQFRDRSKIGNVTEQRKKEQEQMLQPEKKRPLAPKPAKRIAFGFVQTGARGGGYRRRRGGASSDDPDDMGPLGNGFRQGGPAYHSPPNQGRNPYPWDMVPPGTGQGGGFGALGTPHGGGWLGQGSMGGFGAPHATLAKDKATGNAEIMPLVVDPSIGFDQVGGLDQYVHKLKEMVFLPLLYPELFEKFQVQPPRGVLFYGPPGTGKTLVARALAAQASLGAGCKVSFFMRKGADILSKWIGEAERQLRLLFEEAARCAPSIIFFDEIDGLAPSRSGKVDQLHNSIVSTLLALMDGLDSRGKVVVIGATNRIDSIDAALRRPGRFDRELLFPLPGLQARLSILRIHTRNWIEPPSSALLSELAAMAVGYCGADLKALCAEAALHALRRRYPQIYETSQKLLISAEAVKVEREDFLAAAAGITPASHRSAAAHSHPMSPVVGPVLLPSLAKALSQIMHSFPHAAECIATSEEAPESRSQVALPAELRTLAARLANILGPRSDPGGGGGGGRRTASGGGSLALGRPGVAGSWSTWLMRPRMLICGRAGCGQGALAASLLHALEGLPVHSVGLPGLVAVPGIDKPEQALVQAILEARRAAPAILYLPNIQMWWTSADPALRAVLLMALSELPSSTPLLLLAHADVPASDLDEALDDLFSPEDILELDLPTAEQRSDMFRPVLVDELPQPVKQLAGAVQVVPEPEVLPLDPDAIRAREEAVKAAEHEKMRVRYEEDAAVLRELRISLRQVTNRLLTEKQWSLFWTPVDPAEYPGYYEAVTCPCDLGTILVRLNDKRYNTVAAYLAEFELIKQGWREYCLGTSVAHPAVVSNNHAAPATAGPKPPVAAAPHTTVGLTTPATAPPGPKAPGSGDQTLQTHPQLPTAPATAPPAVGASLLAAAPATAPNTDAAAALQAVVVMPAGAQYAKQLDKAYELYDVASQQVSEAVSALVWRRCEEIEAHGGPAPPPPGLKTPEQIAAEARAAEAAAKARRDEEDRRKADAGGGGASGRVSTRRGTGVPDELKQLLHNDPEALMRRTKQLQKQIAAVNATANNNDDANTSTAAFPATAQPPEAGVADAAAAHKDAVGIEICERCVTQEAAKGGPSAVLANGGVSAEGTAQAEAATDKPRQQGVVDGDGAVVTEMEVEHLVDSRAGEAAEKLLSEVVQGTEGWTLDSLERLHAEACRVVWGHSHQSDRLAAVQHVWLKLIAYVQRRQPKQD